MEIITVIEFKGGIMMPDREKVIREFRNWCETMADECPVICHRILDLLEAKSPIHVHQEYPEHDWKTDEDGKIDEWVIDYGYHNGPGCKRCGYSFCMHCKPNGWDEKPCVIDYYQCPKCGERILKNGKNIEYCINCGQAVKWE